MANKELTLPSGAILSISSASFREGHNLFKAVMKELGTLDMSLEINTKLRIKLISSDEIEKALWPCMARCTYDKVKITPEMFDAVEGSVNDFLEIALEVLGFNLDPFFRNQSLKLNQSTPIETSTLK